MIYKYRFTQSIFITELSLVDTIFDHFDLMINIVYINPWNNPWKVNISEIIDVYIQINVFSEYPR